MRPNFESRNITSVCLTDSLNFRLINDVVSTAGEMEKVFTGFWLGGPKVRNNWEDLGVGGRITLRWTLGRQGSMGRTGFGWLKIGSNYGLL
jgi:hypothetical protein